ncbi:MAG: transposase [Gammaproteobacteria bacterium]|jgi:predicted transposase/invertase (TIGR01784 family)|nr:transposase [Gammaproteobacteria bacterium]
MKGIRSKHDAFFKAMMKDPQVSQDFFKTRLPQEIQNLVDLSTLRIEPASYIDKKLNHSESDMLFSVKRNHSDENAFLFLLCEHQSCSDQLMPFRLLYYMMQILRHHVTIAHKEKPLPLPLVYPMVVYNGDTAWSHERCFSKLFGTLSPLAEKIFIDPFPLRDVGSLNEENLSKAYLSNLMLISLKRAKHLELSKKCRLLQGLFLNCKIGPDSDMVYSVIEYILANVNSNEEEVDRLWGILKEGFLPE